MLITPYPVTWADVSPWQRHRMSRSILVLLHRKKMPLTSIRTSPQLPLPAQWLSGRARILPVLGPSSQWVTSEFGKLGLACVL